MEFITHDNRRRPFKVSIQNERVKIFNNETQELIKEYLSVKEYFAGYGYIHDVKEIKENLPEDFDYGNSILLVLKHNKYCYIGDTVYEFTTEEPITDYYSPIGNNDVPYPVAVTKLNVYFMLDKKQVLAKYFPFSRDYPEKHAYKFFYGHIDSIPRENYATDMNYTMVQERLV